MRLIFGDRRLQDCRYGPMLYLPTDEYIGQALHRYGEFSEGEAFFFRQLVKQDWTVLDIGANHGAHTIALAKATRTVHAFEPQRILFQILCANVALNDLTNVYTHQVAVGRELGTINVPTLDYTKSGNFGALAMGGTGGEQVPLVTLDSLNIPCQFIKADVEGMESDVVTGAEMTLRQYRPILYLENDRPDKSAALIEQLLKLDYRLYWHMPYYFNCNNYFGATENIYGRTISVNMLCAHKSQPQQIGLREILTPADTWKSITAP